MSDSNIPIVPARPTAIKRESQTSTTIPSIPARPHKQVKSVDTKNAQKTKIGGDFDIDEKKKSENVTEISKPVQNLEVTPQSIDSDGEDSANVLSEIVSDFNEDSSPENSPIVKQGDISNDDTPNLDSKAVPAGQIDESVVDVSTIKPEVQSTDELIEQIEPIESPVSKSESSGHVDDISAVKPDIDVPKPDIEVEDKANTTTETTPQIPTRPRKVVKKDFSIIDENAESQNAGKNVPPDADKNEELIKTTNQHESLGLEAVEKESTEPLGNTLSQKSSTFSKKNSGTDEPLDVLETQETESKALTDSTEKVILETSETPDEAKSAKKVDTISTSESSPVTPLNISGPQPTIPKRPSKPSTPKIPTRPVKQERSSSSAESSEMNSVDQKNTDYITNKGPPPKPKKLSSKIAAFQQMFNQAPLEHTQPKSGSFERNKLSSNRTDFASNLQNVMGRGLPLPGMANPEILKKISQPDGENDTQSENSSETLNSPVPRRTRGPRGKKLPKSIQETKIVVEPRFTVTSFDVWEFKSGKKVLEKDLVDENVSEKNLREYNEISEAEVLNKDEQEKIAETGGGSEGSKVKPQIDTEAETEMSPVSVPDEKADVDLSFGTNTPGSFDGTEENAFEDAKEQDSNDFVGSDSDSHIQENAGSENAKKHVFVSETSFVDAAEEENLEKKSASESPDVAESTNDESKFVTASTSAKCSRVSSNPVFSEEDIKEVSETSDTEN